jgi:ubiquinone/menaquinone biosynthesis C-methylase UbiE
MDARQPGHPVFAWTYDALTRGAERRLIGPQRQRLIDACSGSVLEVGAGTGASFPYWRDALHSGAVTSLAAVEPDPWMRLRAQRRAARLHLEVDLRSAPGEELPFPDGSFDSVAVFLVLCTVDDPARALAEARRVLRPGGTLAFLEHVRADGGAAVWQRRLRGLWAVLAAGCQLDRDTERAIGAAGFADLAVTVRPLPFPLYRMVAGTARRTG